MYKLIKAWETVSSDFWTLLKILSACTIAPDVLSGITSFYFSLKSYVVGTHWGNSNKYPLHAILCRNVKTFPLIILLNTPSYLKKRERQNTYRFQGCCSSPRWIWKLTCFFSGCIFHGKISLFHEPQMYQPMFKLWYPSLIVLRVK